VPIDPLNAATDVIGRDHGRPKQILLQAPGEAAIVADVERFVRSNRQPVRPAAGARDYLNDAAWQHPADGLPLDLDQHDGTVPHRHRTFRKAEPGRHNPHFAHCSLPPIGTASVADPAARKSRFRGAPA